MRIVTPYARMLAPLAYDSGGSSIRPFIAQDGVALLRRVEWCARISHRSEDAVTDNSWERILKSVVLDHGDWSVTEHVTITVDAVVDRGITHEWVRHRIGAYTQESTRFVNYEKKMAPSFIYPIPEVECERCLVGDEHYGGDLNVLKYGNWWVHKLTGEKGAELCAYDVDWINAIHAAEQAYKRLVTPKDKGGKGWRPQEARSVFPNALASRLVTTYNLRNWRHFFLMRTTKEAHPQMRQVTIPLLKEFQEKIPLLYDDIVPNARQIDNLRLPR